MTLLTLGRVDASITLLSLNRNVNLLNVKTLVANYALRCHELLSVIFYLLT